MGTTTFLMALALMLVFEGVLPFIAPNLWRDTFRKITQLSDGQIRFVGLSSMLVGLLLLLWVTLREVAPARVHRRHPAGGGDAHRERCAARSSICSSRRSYELVMPPLLEYMDSLLTGTGHDLELRTFKVVDQLSGRMMGVRADITPQVARIDAHLLNRKGVTRLCYCGSVLHTRPRGAGRDARADPDRRRDVRRGRRRRRRRDARAPVPGAAHRPARATCASTSATSAVFRAIAHAAKVGAELEAELFEALQRKDVPALQALTEKLADRDPRRAAPAAEPLRRRRGARRGREAPAAHRRVTSALATLRRLAQACKFPASFDLAELRGYHYHSGVVFDAYCDGVPGAVARGGRYDEVGKAFGRARPATGFSIDLRSLAGMMK